MNIASIDIGSNTVLLLIASIRDNKLFPILNQYFSPRLGKGLKIGGQISQERISKLIDVLNHYKKLIEKHTCQKTIITATNAMRIASNSQEIIDIVKNSLKMDIEIISGDDEAKLSYLGAASTVPDISEKVVIDIGGGSTEIIYGNEKEILFKKSFQTGVVSLTEEFLNTFPYNKDNLQNAYGYINNVFSILKETIPRKVPTIAVAGTPTTLSCINQNLKTYDEKKVESSIITSDELNELFNRLNKLSGEQIKTKFGEVVNGREDVLFSGTLILRHIIREILVDKIIVSGRGLRYGNIIGYVSIFK